ncbi:MAG: hypothetical protein QNK99_07465 [Burkholderiales bacterium]
MKLRITLSVLVIFVSACGGGGGGGGGTDCCSPPCFSSQEPLSDCGIIPHSKKQHGHRRQLSSWRSAEI